MKEGTAQEGVLDLRASSPEQVFHKIQVFILCRLEPLTKRSRWAQCLSIAAGVTAAAEIHYGSLGDRIIWKATTNVIAISG